MPQFSVAKAAGAAGIGRSETRIVTRDKTATRFGAQAAERDAKRGAKHEAPRGFVPRHKRGNAPGPQDVESPRDGRPGKAASPASLLGGGDASGAFAGTKPRASNVRDGVLNMNPRGFGFVASIDAPGDDVYISPDQLNRAVHGDKVRVRVTGRGQRGPEGAIEKVIEHGVTRVAGILRRRGTSAWLEPDDPRGPARVELVSEIDRDSSGGGNSGNDGDVAVVRITRWAEFERENPQGTLEAVLGRPGELRVEIQKTMVLAQIPELHSPEATAEAEAYGLEVPVQMLEGRKDYTAIPLPTIDPDDARDHDDAVWVERTTSGGFKAYVAIADVSSYVRPGTKIDEEAEQRGCSVYLPDRAIPMLPRALSSNLCSLLPDVIRLCLCAEVELDGAGTIQKSSLHRGFMKSAAKLTYGGVARALGYSEIPPVQPAAEAMIDGLKVAAQLSNLLRAKRMERGALDFELPEAKVILDKEGQPETVTRRAADPGMKKAYSLIEELMLLGNEVVATWTVENNLPAIYRVHLPPDETKLQRLVKMTEQLGVPFDMEDVRDPKRLSELLRSFAKHPLANVLNMLLLRAMKQAIYDVANRGHFGLASKAYLHFTSPIRRYPDLVVHRVVHQKLLGQHISTSEDAKEALASAALQSSTNERRAMEVEREIVDLYRCVLMRKHIGERFEGTVTSVVGSGIFVVLDEPFVDVLVKLDDLGGDKWEIDDDGLRAVASRSGQSIGLGDRINLEIIDAAILRRTVYGRRVPAPGEKEMTRRPKLSEALLGSPRGGADKPTKEQIDRGRGRKDGKPGSRDPHGTKARAAKAGEGKAGKPGKFARGGKPGKPAKAGKKGKKR